MSCLHSHALWPVALAVSNSRGCCFAAPGDHQGAWCHNFSTATNILLIKSNLKFNREQPQPLLPCHHVILVASIAVASTPGRENARASFYGRLSLWNRTAPERRHLFPVATCLVQRNRSCGVLKSWMSDAHWPFQWKWQVLHNCDISVLQQFGMFFDGIACLKVWPLSKWEFPRVAMTWRSALAQISDVTSQT